MQTHLLQLLTNVFLCVKLICCNVIDLSDILNVDYMPGSLLVLEDPESTAAFMNHSTNTDFVEHTGSYTDALVTMGFHRKMMNEYLCRNYISEQILLEMRSSRIRRRLGTPADNKDKPNIMSSKVNFSVKNNLLDDEGSATYQEWLKKSATLEDIYRHYDTAEKREATDNSRDSVDDINEEFDTHITGYGYQQTNSHLPSKLGHTETGAGYPYHHSYPSSNLHSSGGGSLYGHSGHSGYGIGSLHTGHSGPTVYHEGGYPDHHHEHTPKYHSSYSDKDKLADLFDIALTALAYLSFGMFIIQVIMCISMTNTTTAPAMTMMPMSMSPTGMEATGGGMMGGEEMPGGGTGGEGNNDNGGTTGGESGVMGGEGTTEAGGGGEAEGGDGTAGDGTAEGGTSGGNGEGGGTEEGEGNGEGTTGGDGGTTGENEETPAGNGEGGMENGMEGGTGEGTQATGEGALGGDGENDGTEGAESPSEGETGETPTGTGEGGTGDGMEGEVGGGDEGANGGGDDGENGETEGNDAEDGNDGGDGGADGGTTADGDEETTADDSTGTGATGGTGETGETGTGEGRDTVNFRNKRAIPTIVQPNNEALNELARRILISIEAALVAHQDDGNCLRKVLCENNAFSRRLQSNQKYWIPVWSLGMSWLSGRLVENIPKATTMLVSLKASLLGLGNADCEFLYRDCDLSRERQKRRRRRRKRGNY